MSERDGQRERMEASGAIDPECETCQHHFYASENPVDVFAPRHSASTRCESGKRPHCTCDTCF